MIVCEPILIRKTTAILIEDNITLEIKVLLLMLDLLYKKNYLNKCQSPHFMGLSFKKNFPNQTCIRQKFSLPFSGSRLAALVDKLWVLKKEYIPSKSFITILPLQRNKINTIINKHHRPQTKN
jgi:hypothetical protein